MSKQYSALLDSLLNGEALTEQEAYALMHALADGELPAALAGALLAGLRAKGETADEIRGFATAMRELAVHPSIPDGAPTVDTVGTWQQPAGRASSNTAIGRFRAVRVVPTCLRALECRCRCMRRKLSNALRRPGLRSCLRRHIIRR